ncbi:MAG: T9SS type A sorting domain-containing protein [candidate division WOR-3 bacterium]
MKHYFILVFITSLFGRINVEWRLVGMGGGGWFTAVAIDTLIPGTVYVGSDVGGFYKSTNYGASWRVCNNGLIDYYVEKILPDPRNPGVIYLGTWGGIHKSTDGGETWQPKRNGFPLPNRNQYTAPIGALAIHPDDSRIVYAGIGMPRLGYKDSTRWWLIQVKGTIYKTTDGGETWRPIRNTGIDTNALFYDLIINPKNPNVLYAATHLGVYKSTNGGDSWRLKNNGLPPIPESVVVRSITIDPNDTARIYVAVGPDLDQMRNSICSGIWFSTNSGENWYPCTTGISRNNFRRIIVNPKNPWVLYAGALYGVQAGVYKSTDRGNSWTRITTEQNVHRGWIRFWEISPDGLALDNRDTTMIFYTNSHAVIKTTNFGNSWFPCYTESVGPNDNWRGTGLEVTCVRQVVSDPIDSNIVYVALSDVGLWKTTDRGYSFRYIHGPMRDSGNTTYYLAIHPNNHNILYAGTGPWHRIYGKLWHSTDGGETWHLLYGLPDTAYKSPILIHPNSREDSTVLYVWVSRYGVYKSTDGGESWERKNNGLNIPLASDSFTHSHPQMMAMDINNPEILYLCLPKRRKLYKTINGGDTWFELPLPRSNLETWGVAVSPINSAVFLWTRASIYGGLYRSFNGGLSWDSLPIFRIDGYDPCIRTVGLSPFDVNLVVLGTLSWATHDSSTGLGVYISTDCGETWQDINEGLGILRTFYLTFDLHNPRIIYLGTSGNGVFVCLLPEIAKIKEKEREKGNLIKFDTQVNLVNKKIIISFNLPIKSDVNLNIYNLNGQIVSKLWKNSLPAGNYKFVQNFLFKKGVYFLVLYVGENRISRKLILIY